MVSVKIPKNGNISEKLSNNSKKWKFYLEARVKISPKLKNLKSILKIEADWVVQEQKVDQRE